MDYFIISAKIKNELLWKKDSMISESSRKHNIYFKWSKYDFDTKEIPILRVVVE